MLAKSYPPASRLDFTKKTINCFETQCTFRQGKFDRPSSVRQGEGGARRAPRAGVASIRGEKRTGAGLARAWRGPHNRNQRTRRGPDAGSVVPTPHTGWVYARTTLSPEQRSLRRGGCSRGTVEKHQPFPCSFLFRHRHFGKSTEHCEATISANVPTTPSVHATSP
eukprot:gene12102-biopygen9465